MLPQIKLYKIKTKYYFSFKIRIDFWNVAQCLAVDICIFSHHLQNEESLIRIRVVTSLITVDQFSHSLHYCLES